MMPCVYAARNTKNGKVYVGKTVNTLNRRKRAHLAAARSGCDFLFYRAIRKHGARSFEWTILVDCQDTTRLNEIEIEQIKLHNSKSPNGYNLTDGGEGMLGMDLSVRRKISLANKGRPKSEECKLKLRLANLGRSMPVNVKEVMKRVHLGRKNSEKTKLLMSQNNWMKGRVHSEESKQLMSIAHTGKVLSLETRLKMSIARIGNKNSLGRTLSPEHRAKLSKARLGTKRSEETKVKMSISIKLALKLKRESLQRSKR